MIIAISGTDGVGKSQQIRLLHFYGENNLRFAKPLIEYGSRWPKKHGSQMFNWWFRESNIVEFVGIVIEALNFRHQEIDKGGVTILDRGTSMFKAVCVATIAARTTGKLSDIRDFVNKRFASELLYSETEEYNILLLSDNEYKNSIASFLSLLNPGHGAFSTEENRFYARYQDLLKEEMAYLFLHTRKSVIPVNAPICDIQNRIRGLISQVTNLNLPPLCEGIQRIVGFGGLSECGKSSFADYLCKRQGFYRLKLGYFVELAKRHGIDNSPENVATEVAHFCQLHYYIKYITLESLHEPHTPAFLKLLFGSRFKIVYLDVPFETRVRRASHEQGVAIVAAEEKTAHKDLLKKQRGVETVRRIADVCFDNSGNDQATNLRNFEASLAI